MGMHRRLSLSLSGTLSHRKGTPDCFRLQSPRKFRRVDGTRNGAISGLWCNRTIRPSAGSYPTDCFGVYLSSRQFSRLGRNRRLQRYTLQIWQSMRFMGEYFCRSLSTRRAFFSSRNRFTRSGRYPRYEVDREPRRNSR